MGDMGLWVDETSTEDRALLRLVRSISNGCTHEHWRDEAEVCTILQKEFERFS